MKKFLLPIAAAWFVMLFAPSCGGGTSSKYPGYTEVEQGIFYKLHEPGESGKKAGPEDFYEVHMVNKYGGTVFFDSELENARGTLMMQSAASRYFSVLSEGDSATFLLPGGDLHMPGTPDTGMIEMTVKVVDILTPDEVEKRERSTDPDLDEQVLIKRFMSKNKLAAQPDSEGLYFISEKEGTGAAPSAGKKITVQYSGMLFNNHVFDDSRQGGAPFTFTWGEEEQMLPGIIRALAKMKAGGKAKIILPSPLAFGAEGSSTGIVPPHTPVVYEVELVSVE